MSFGGSLWCQPMSMDAHRSTDQDEVRSTDYSNHQSTSSAKSTAECSAVRIMTHEEFAEKHPHPPYPFYVKIDRRHEPAVDRHRETDIDRPPTPPIDRRAPLTYRVRLPSIDSDRINALRPPPKPLANPPEPTTNPSDTTPEPMKDDEATFDSQLDNKRRRKYRKGDRDIHRTSRIAHRDIAANYREVPEYLKDRWASKKKKVSAEIWLQEVTANIDLLTELKDGGLTVDAELARLKGMEGDCEDLVASAPVPDWSISELDLPQVSDDSVDQVGGSSVPDDYDCPITEDLDSVAHFVRHFKPAGCPLPALRNMTERET
ncbi:hypothetical protein DY000_02049204 [Brassica cretica]|uniref:Uncharacterized protein n=1 Tax=Brassica cretica TaxID=69181 RepID=A0ABQ7ESU7_BRACR|nr:hypothetical protein DY000_02049204 [Brassica cretica]